MKISLTISYLHFLSLRIILMRNAHSQRAFSLIATVQTTSIIHHNLLVWARFFPCNGTFEIDLRAFGKLLRQKLANA